MPGEQSVTPAGALVWVDGADPDLVAGAGGLAAKYSGAGLVVQDRSGFIAAANDRATALLGLLWAQLVGRTSRDTRWAAVSEQGLPLIGDQHPAMRTLATGEPVRGFLMGVLIPGLDSSRTCWLDVSAYPIAPPHGL